MEHIGKVFMAIGGLLFILGGLLTIGGRFGLGRLPMDIVIKKGNFTFYFPIATSIILSLLLSLVIRFFNKR